MSVPRLLGFGRSSLPDSTGPWTEHVIVRRPLQRVLAFTGKSIDDVVNSPIVKNQVLGYYKLHRWVDRECEISDLERAWNPLGHRT
jgi:hypothetical protein